MSRGLEGCSVFTKSFLAFTAMYSLQILLGLVILYSFFRPEFSPVIHIPGLFMGTAVTGIGAYGIFLIRRERGRRVKIRHIALIAIFLFVDIVYGFTIRDLPHDLRTAATFAFDKAYRLNRFLGGGGKPELMAGPQKNDGRAGFVPGTWKIFHKGFYTFSTDLHYLRVDPSLFRVRVAYGKPTNDLVLESGALAGINGGYLSKRFGPLGLLVVEGQELSPYVSSNIDVEMGTGERITVPARSYRERSGPFAVPGSIRSAKQHAPQGLLIRDGMILREFNDRYKDPLLGTEAILAVLDDGSVTIVPSSFYEIGALPFDVAGRVRYAFQAGPLTYFDGKLTDRDLQTAEPTRGKVAFAVDADKNLYLMATESFRGMYGLTYSEFTRHLVEFGDREGIRFEAVAFGDAGGAGTLTVFDEEHENYRVTGAAIKYVSSSAVLVFPNSGSRITKKEIPFPDWSHLSAEAALSLFRRSPATIAAAMGGTEPVFSRWWRSSGLDTKRQLAAHAKDHLRSFEEGGRNIGRAFLDISDSDPADGLLFLEMMGAEELARIFLNYYHGDRVADPHFVEYERAVPRVLAAGPEKAARLLLDLSHVGLGKDYPRNLFRLPPNRFHNLDSGKWIASGLLGRDYGAASEILACVLRAGDNGIVLAQFHEALLFSSHRGVYKEMAGKVISKYGTRWVARGLIGAIRSWLPQYEEYYHMRAADLVQSLTSLSPEIRISVIKQLESRGYRWSVIEGIAKARGLSDRFIKKYHLNPDGEDVSESLMSLSKSPMAEEFHREFAAGELDHEIDALYHLVMEDSGSRFPSQATARQALGKLEIAAHQTRYAALAADRLSDIALAANDPQIRSSATSAVIENFERHLPGFTDNPRVLLLLARQRHRPDIREKALVSIRTNSISQEAMARIAMTSSRHVYKSPVATYRDVILDFFKPRSP